MQNHWLYEQIRIEKEKPDWEPTFALQGALNWMKVLSFEILKEHGASTNEQMKSCKDWFASNVKSKDADVPLAPIFGPLFHSLTFSVSLLSLSEHNVCAPWMFPGAVVSWYYAVYNAFKSILASFDGRQTDTHSSMIKALIGPSIRTKLPHPFNMVANRESGETYQVSLPSYPGARRHDLHTTFDDERSTAQGMLLAYLNGTAEWEVKKIKQRIMEESKGKIANFRTKEAKARRDKHLPAEVNFLNCAFRYRGKANYRDSMFLAYGQDDKRLNSDFILNLGNVARFAFLCGLAYAECRIGKKKIRSFLTDVDVNLRGQVDATTNEKFWTNL